MTWRPPAAVCLVILLCAAVWGWVILWGLSGHRQARRVHAELATERAAHALEVEGWETALARRERDLERRMNDTVAAILATHGATPTTVVEVEVQVTDTVVVYADPTTPGDIWRARISDGLIWADLTVDESERSVAMAYQITARGELVGALMPDGRYMVAARGTDPRVSLAVPELYWRPPPPKPGPSRLRWLIGGVVVGVIGWEVAR